MERQTKKNILTFILILTFFSAFLSAQETTNSLGMKMIRIEPGSFQMGSTLGRDYWDEQPVHKATISKPFYMSETEVTAEQFMQFKSDFSGNKDYLPYASSVSWYDAAAFCEWLSKKEGKAYRLPTEAEWEYACRSGSTTLYSTGDNEPEAEKANQWGLKNMHTGVREWCFDWYGEYLAEDQVDPVGSDSGMGKVVRGGSLDDGTRDKYRKIFNSSSNRASIAPSFGPYPKEKGKDEMAPGQIKEGLIGVWFEMADLTKPRGTDVIDQLYNNWINDGGGERGRNWSATWTGLIEAPFSGEVKFEAEADRGCIVKVNNNEVINIWDGTGNASGTLTMVKGVKYPIAVSYNRQGRTSFIRVSWSWQEQSKTLIPAKALSYSYLDWADATTKVDQKDVRPGLHNIGFRIVQGPMPASKAQSAKPSYVTLGVKANKDIAKMGPDMTTPHFRKRYLLPTPLDNSSNEEIDAVGMHPSFRNHCHSPGLEVCPNGDVLMVIYTSYSEYEPGVSLIGTRLRQGADQWDMPDRLFDFAAVNDHCPLLWTDGDTLNFFWGNPKLVGGFPFQWLSSKDSGGTWSEVQFPMFKGEIGSHSRQPINTILRDKNNTIYVSSDGSGGRSVLWATKDQGKIWYDTVGRTYGRHTTFALQGDGQTILGMGGKSTDIDGFMPKSISRDGGKSYEVTKTPFPAQGGNQRPSILRLQSGRLFFAGDFQHISGKQPEGIQYGGSYVALSEDEGENWKIKPLPGAQRHENRNNHKGNATIGYSAARQGQNGMIHLITTMNQPCLHFELNEKWILSNTKDHEISEREKMASKISEVQNIKTYKEYYPDKKLKMIWSGGTGNDGSFVLDGDESWYYQDGSLQRQAGYKLGKKVGTETYWAKDGTKKWTWQHNEDGTSVWTQYWPNAQKKAESTWKNFQCHGIALLWDMDGKKVSEKNFVDGKIKD